MKRVLVGLMAALIVGCGPGAPAPTGPSVPTGTPAATATASARAVVPTRGPTAPAATATTSPTEEPEPTDATGSLPDPCALVTVAEASAATLVPMADGTHELVSTPTLGSGRQCWLRNTSGDDGDVLVSTFPNPGDLWEAYKTERSQFGSLTDLAGVGDDGFTVGNGECVVLKGDVLMELVMTPGDGYATDPEPRTLVLCGQVAARL